LSSPRKVASLRSDLTIRTAEEADTAAISALARRTWADAFGDSLSPEELAIELEQTRSEEYFRTALDVDTILVAELGAELVGYVQFGDVTIPGVDVQPGDRGLRRVYVERDLQGRGIGRGLMDAALAHPRLRAGDRIYLAVWEKNTNAIRLYESLGFRTVGTTRFTIGSAEVVEDLVMVLDKTAASTG
jgi:ribosomal protein S18 acetylase RimI-like enzyme